jgi:carbohydrate-selective porin OprB
MKRRRPPAYVTQESPMALGSSARWHIILLWLSQQGLGGAHKHRAGRATLGVPFEVGRVFKLGRCLMLT